MAEYISNRQFDWERALYGAKDCVVENCIFAGPADGESALKESKNIKVTGCEFSLRYPLWHVTGFSIASSKMDEKTRAAIWYSKKGKINDCVLGGIKAVRECKDIEINNSEIDSTEFGWKSKKIKVSNSSLNGEYAFFDSEDLKLDNVKLTGKYSFQYVRGLVVQDCVFDTKDAFWHGEDIVVINSVIKGEYAAWFAKNITFINCKISGTQPFCYCKNLKLINCTMEGTDLSFEYSSVKGDIKGHIDSVKNLLSGKVVADSIGEIIFADSTKKCKGKIIVRTDR